MISDDKIVAGDIVDVTFVGGGILNDMMVVEPPHDGFNTWVLKDGNDNLWYVGWYESVKRTYRREYLGRPEKHD